jgi:mannose-6-phosphate isomerase-like protein (cupin superfamily)/pyrroloquinoline quinone (PQQ) biosynthesis protein C
MAAQKSSTLIKVSQTKVSQLLENDDVLRANAETQITTTTANKIKNQSDVVSELDRLNEFVQNHSFWNNRMFKACLAGELSKSDFAYIFSQYYLYSKNFTCYIAGLMANCDKDHFRAKLTQNLWEESGEDDKLSHAEIFRNFLHKTFNINDLDKINYDEFTVKFVESYFNNCIKSNTVSASAWLSLGTEGIVSKMYQIMVQGMLQTGIPSDELEFFHIHIGCDDEHAETLADLMCSYSDRSDWFKTCQRAADEALTLRAQFFEDLYDNLDKRLERSILQSIEAPKSLATGIIDLSMLKSDREAQAKEIYRNKKAKFNIDFAVDRLSFPATQVLDPRIIKILPGKNNEKHRHAHEAVFYIIQGSGLVSIDNHSIEITSGDTVFIPRWCTHQSQNTGDVEMKILAVTDFGLTSKILGNYEQKTRLKSR